MDDEPSLVDIGTHTLSSIGYDVTPVLCSEGSHGCRSEILKLHKRQLLLLMIIPSGKKLGYSVTLVYTSKISYSSFMKNYKLLNHTADIRIEVWGKTRKDLFANAVKAMFDLMIDMSGDKERKKLVEKTIKIVGNDLEDTLINFLREALYLFNGQGWLVRDCKPLELDKKRIVAQFQGEPYSRQKNPLKTEIKAVTYHGLMISKSNKFWQAKVVFDV